MNCSDVVHFLVEPQTAPDSVKEHLDSCGTCRAHAAESRRVAALMAEMPFQSGSDVAAAVMSRIGYGNGRPTRDKILDQLDRVREELEKVVGDLDDGQTGVCVGDDPSIAELLAHLPGVEATLQIEAELALSDELRVGAWDPSAAFDPSASAAFKRQAADAPTPDHTPPADPRRGASLSGQAPTDIDPEHGQVAHVHNNSAADHVGDGDTTQSDCMNAIGNGSADDSTSETITAGLGSESVEHLRRVRERTLRLISELGGADLTGRAAELLRSIYRHEADHIAQVQDTRWRLHRLEELRRPI